MAKYIMLVRVQSAKDTDRTLITEIILDTWRPISRMHKSPPRELGVMLGDLRHDFPGEDFAVLGSAPEDAAYRLPLVELSDERARYYGWIASEAP